MKFSIIWHMPVKGVKGLEEQVVFQVAESRAVGVSNNSSSSE